MISLDFGAISYQSIVILRRQINKKIITGIHPSGIGLTLIIVNVYDIWEKRSSCRSGYWLFIY